MSILYSTVPLFSSPIIFFPMQWLEFVALIEGWHPLCNDSHAHYRISPMIQPSISFALLFFSLWICILRYSLISACLTASSDFRTSFPFASQFTVILYQVEFELLDLFCSFCFPNHFFFLKFSPTLQGERNTWNYHSVSGSFKLEPAVVWEVPIKMPCMNISSSTLIESCEAPSYKFTFKTSTYDCHHLAEKLRLGPEVPWAKKESLTSERVTLNFWVLSSIYLTIVWLSVKMQVSFAVCAVSIPSIYSLLPLLLFFPGCGFLKPTEQILSFIGNFLKDTLKWRQQDTFMSQCAGSNAWKSFYGEYNRVI